MQWWIFLITYNIYFINTYEVVYMQDIIYSTGVLFRRFDQKYKEKCGNNVYIVVYIILYLFFTDLYTFINIYEFLYIGCYS
jgi:hypothetical protein